MMIKLESGEYLITDLIGFIDGENMRAVLKEPIVTFENSISTDKRFKFAVTENDISAIMRAINGDQGEMFWRDGSPAVYGWGNKTYKVVPDCGD